MTNLRFVRETNGACNERLKRHLSNSSWWQIMDMPDSIGLEVGMMIGRLVRNQMAEWRQR